MRGLRTPLRLSCYAVIKNALALDYVSTALDGEPPIEEAKRRIQEAMLRLYRDHIFPDPDRKEREFSLLIGLWSPPEQFLLLKTDRNSVIDVPRYEALGIGWELASYLLDQIYDPLELTTSRGIALAVHVLMETKKYVQGCGGQSSIIRILRSGHIGFIAPDQIDDYERYLRDFNKEIRPVMFSGIDISVTGPEFDLVISKAVERLQTLRSTKFAQMQALRKKLSEQTNGITEDTAN